MTKEASLGEQEKKGLGEPGAGRTATAEGQKERPILFSAPMVRAILDGRKTQTRRTVKDNSVAALSQAVAVSEIQTAYWQFRSYPGDAWTPSSKAPEAWVCGAPCPYGSVGDRLWVRETFATRVFQPWETVSQDKRKHYTIYRADSKTGAWDDGHWHDFGKGWKPSIHMPRWASRITLEITKVRVERLQDINDADIIAEGVTVPIAAERTGTPWSEIPDLQTAWRLCWDSINGKGAWDANPWVWVLEFKRVLCGNVTKSDAGSGFPKTPQSSVGGGAMG